MLKVGGECGNTEGAFCFGFSFVLLTLMIHSVIHLVKTCFGEHIDLEFMIPVTHISTS